MKVRIMVGNGDGSTQITPAHFLYQFLSHQLVLDLKGPRCHQRPTHIKDIEEGLRTDSVPGTGPRHVSVSTSTKVLDKFCG